MIAFVTFGQSKLIELDEIKRFVNSEAYENLTGRYRANDTTWLLDVYVKIYYGLAYCENYKPNARHDSVRVPLQMPQPSATYFNL